MSITRPVVRNVVRDVVKAVIRGESDITRYFTESNSITQTYGQFTSDITAAGDYEAEFLVYKPAGKLLRPFGNNATLTSQVFINTDGSVRFRAGETTSGALTSAAGFVPDNKLSLVIVKREGSTGTIAVNSETPVTGTVTTVDALINTIHKQSVSNYTEGGFTANHKLWINGNRNTGTLVVDSPIDDAPDATEYRNIADPSNPIQKFNYVEADTLEYVFDGNVSPNTWTDVDTGLIVIEVAGT